jgi:hypothetical protein
MSVRRAIVSPLLGHIEARRPKVRPGNHLSGGFLVFDGESFADANAMQDLGPMAAKVLHVAQIPSATHLGRPQYLQL